MKRILILLLVAAGFTANAQSYTGDFLNARKRLTVRGSNIDTIKNDTTGLDGRTKTLMTADAVYKLVNGRTLGGGGGGGSQDLASVTGLGNTTTVGIQVGDSMKVQGGTDPFISIRQGTSNQQYLMRIGVGTGLSSQVFNIYNQSAGKHLITGSANRIIIGNPTDAFNNSTVYIKGYGSNGSNLDVQPDSTILDEGNIEIMASNYADGRGIAMRQWGNVGVSGSAMGYQKKNLGMLDFHNETNLIRVLMNRSLRFGTNNVERMVLDSLGRLGIGTTSASAWLHVLPNNSTEPTAYFDAHEDRSGEIVTISQNGVENKKFSFNSDGSFEVQDVATIGTPATPASGYGKFYARNDTARFKNDNGVEFTLGAGGGGGGSSDSTVVRNQRWKYRNTFELMDEFLGNGIAPGWTSQSSGSGAEAGASTYLFADLDSTWQGATYANTGTTTTGKASALYGNATSANTGSLRGINTKKAIYETRVRFDTLSNATNEYTALLGYTEWLGSGFYQSGVKFVYDRATYGDYWVLRADDGGTSAVVTTTAVAAKKNYILRIEIDNWQMGSSGGSVKAYINDVEVVPSSGTYPIVSNINNSLSFYPTYWIQKTTGTIARKLHVDWVYQYYEFITRK